MYKHITDVLCKKRLQKTLIFLIEKWDDFENLKNGHYEEAIAFVKWSVWVKRLMLNLFFCVFRSLFLFFAEDGNDSEVNTYS